MILEIVVTIFVIFAISRSILRFRGTQNIKELALWIVVWGTVELIVLFPSMTNIPARFLNITRGIDAIIYISIVALLYSTYRIYSKMEKIEQDITALTRHMAIEKRKKQ